MTPMAAQLFRHGEPIWRTLLPHTQFFECTAIAELALEMAAAEGEAPFSEFAVLPATSTVLELHHPDAGRVMMLALQEGDIVHTSCFIQDARGAPALYFRSGFKPGTFETLPTGWRKSDAGTALGPQQESLARGLNAVVEKLLCILNQPGLIEHKMRPTDKRVLRELDRTAAKDRSHWHECRIRAGAHRHTDESSEAAEPVMPLHYVRKYLRRSAKRWVDGYWRGDIALGTHLKWYSPAAGAELNATRHTPTPLGSIGAAH